MTSIKIFNFQKETNIFTLDTTVSLYDRYALHWCSNNVGLEKHSLNLNIEDMSSCFEAYFVEKKLSFFFSSSLRLSPTPPDLSLFAKHFLNKIILWAQDCENVDKQKSACSLFSIR